jgi:predicted RNA binding protein YcfA (HicA-like mRNA interferase family)
MVPEPQIALRLLTAARICKYFAIMPRKIRQLIADLESAGFQIVPGGKGSHRKFRHPQFAGAVILSGKDSDDALPYQEKQTRNAVREVSK